MLIHISVADTSGIAAILFRDIAAETPPPPQTAAQMLHSIPDTDAQIYSYCSASGCTCGYASIPGCAAHILPKLCHFFLCAFLLRLFHPTFGTAPVKNPPEKKPFPTVPSGFSPHTPAPYPTMKRVRNPIHPSVIRLPSLFFSIESQDSLLLQTDSQPIKKLRLLCGAKIFL